ncbi:hypothetical protein MMC26_006877 [Xylographa opegraphella]|nr:hypothetical protein [Xylographa opegraphella]
MPTGSPCALLAPIPTTSLQALSAGDGSDCPQGCTLEGKATGVGEATLVLGLEGLSGAKKEAIVGAFRGREEEETDKGHGWDRKAEPDGRGRMGEVWAGKGVPWGPEVEERQLLGIGLGGVPGDLSNDSW